MSLDEVLAVLRQIETVAAKSPARAREVLAGVIEPATLTPGPDGYEISLSLKNETAAIAGGRTLLRVGCGGLILPSTNRVFDRTFFLPKLRPALFKPLA